MLKIKTMRALPRAGAELDPGRCRLALLETDKLKRLNASSVEDLVVAEPDRGRTSFHRRAQALDITLYGLYKIGEQHSELRYERRSRIWLAAGVTRVSSGDFDASLVAGPGNDWQMKSLLNVDQENLLDLQLLHTPYGAIVQVGPRTKDLFFDLHAPRCVFNPLFLDGTEYLIRIGQSCTFSWLFTDGRCSRLLNSAHGHYAQAATLAHRLSMAHREGNKRRNYQAALAYIKENGNQYAAQSL